MSQKSAVQYVKQDEPAFIKRFKEQVGYKEEASIDAKRQKLEEPADEDGDGGGGAPEDEKPVVVVLQPGDLTADEAEQVNCNAGRDPGMVAAGKILFRKPAKKAAAVEAHSSSGQPPTGGDDSDANSASKGRKEPAAKKEFSSKAVKNSSLLSFADDEDVE